MSDGPGQWWSERPPPGHGTSGDRAWAVLAHVGLVPLPIAVPLAVVLGRGHRSAYVCHQAVEALNFHITVVLALLLASVAQVVALGVVVLPVVVLGALTLAGRAAVAARRGAWHRYPCCLRLLS
ncbi:MAG TPA: DUF4870 domain-containing protein [Mycobacteriales bacterium]|jgi:hypothetical protein|nr:DUF4870 domain-containing protein [Mycobacteriales bacterium]